MIVWHGTIISSLYRLYNFPSHLLRSSKHTFEKWGMSLVCIWSPLDLRYIKCLCLKEEEQYYVIKTHIKNIFEHFILISQKNKCL